MRLKAAFVLSVGIPLSAVASPKPTEVAIDTPDIQRSTVLGKRFEQGPTITLRGQLFMPEGTGPFPAIVHLHGCAGVIPARDERWTERFVEWGFAVLRIDSLGARGKTSVCDSPADLPVFNRSGDAYAAKTWLIRDARINAERVLVAGWSHGGWTVLRALGSPPSDFGAAADVKPFRAGIAFYPLCAPPINVQAPILILQGEADTLTPSSLCRAMGKIENIRIQYFAGATHGFDEPGVDEILNGSIIKHDPVAETAAVTFVKSFLDEVGR